MEDGRTKTVWTSLYCVWFVIIFFVCSDHDTSQNLLDGHYDRYMTLVYISGSCIASFDFRKVLECLSEQGVHVT